MATIQIRCYVDHDGCLTTSDTAECLRRATAAERRESYGSSQPEGHILAAVSERTLRRAAPRLARIMVIVDHAAKGA